MGWVWVFSFSGTTQSIELGSAGFYKERNIIEEGKDQQHSLETFSFLNSYCNVFVYFKCLFVFLCYIYDPPENHFQ